MEDFKITMQELLPDLKKSKGDSEGGYTELYVRGLASNTIVDLHDDRMAASAIEAFKKAIDEGMILKNGKWSYIPLRSGHKTEWDDILGWILKAETDDDYNLWIEASLDINNPTAVGLYKKLAEGDKPGKPLQLGLSVGGKIKKASYEWNQVLGKKVRVIEDVMLNEISVVSAPANPPTYLDVLAKSVNWDEILPPNEELLQERAMSDLNKNDETKLEATVVTDGAADPVTEVTADVTTITKGNETEEEALEVSKTVVENAEEVTKAASDSADTKETDPQAEETSETIVPSMDALVKSVEQMQSLLDTVLKSVKPATVVEETKEPAKADTSNVDLAKALGTDLDTRIANAVAAAFETFRKEQLEPLTEKISLIKSAIDEIGDQEMDKSSSVRKAKDSTVDVNDLFNDKLQKARQSGTQFNSIKEAVKLSLNDNS